MKERTRSQFRTNAACIAMLLALSIPLCSCDADYYAGQRPYEQPNTSWACEEYGASFSLGAEGELLEATILVDGESVQFSFLWSDFDNNVAMLLDLDDGVEKVWGLCRFGRDRFSITFEDTRGLFPEQGITMVFDKVP